MQDQRLALQWVQEHIAAFGGDSGSVTLMGQGGGALRQEHQYHKYSIYYFTFTFFKQLLIFLTVEITVKYHKYNETFIHTYPQNLGPT